MKSRKENCILVFVLISILVLSVLYINSLDVSTDETLQENPLQRDEFSIAATYTPGEYPSGLTLLDGDILDAGSGGIFDVTGNFTIVSGATAGIAWPSSYKIIIYADNILIAGILDGNGAGWGGGPGGSVGGVYDYGMDGFCEPQSGAGKGSGEYIGFGGGGAAYGDDGKASLAGGLGGVEFGYAGIVSIAPTPNDIKAGGGGGGGARGTDSWGGNGGFGGAGVYLEAVEDIVVNGTIRCDGDSGQNGESDTDSGAGGGGGGAGGGILLFGNDVVVSGTLSAKGGTFGNGGSGASSGFNGGAGSGGRIKIAYSSSLNTTGASISVIGGDSSNPGTYFPCKAYKVEYDPPSIMLMNPTNGTHHRSNTSIVVNVTDEQDLQQVSYNWDGAANTIVSPYIPSYVLTAFLPPYEGEHVLEVFAQDPLGNLDHKTFTFTTDDTGPTIILESPQNNTVYPSGTLVKLAITDSISLNQTWYNWDGLGGNTSFSESYELLLPSAEGRHNLTIYAYDMADNWNSKTFSFITDDTLPSCTRPADIVYTDGETGHSIGWTPSDVNPGDYVITLDGYPVESGSWSSGMDLNISVDGLTSGVHIYTLVLFDGANNFVSDTVVVTVLEIIQTTTTTTSETTTTSTTSTSPTTAIPGLLGPGLILGSSIGIGGILLGILIAFIGKRKS